MGWFKHQLDLSFLASWNALASVFLRKLSGTPCILRDQVRHFVFVSQWSDSDWGWMDLR